MHEQRDSARFKAIPLYAAGPDSINNTTYGPEQLPGITPSTESETDPEH